MNCKQFWLIGGFVGLGCWASPVTSQIVPDSTTGTAVINNCAHSCQVVGGKLAGQNLFHSFAELNIRPGEKVYFADPGITNIFSRVTGNNASEIFGTLGVLGDGNLFLFNPHGIIFGNGATLDLRGGFLATTADQIEFGDRNFAAVPSPEENLTLLTVNPSALFFNQMGQNQPIILNRGAFLKVPEQQSISLVGSQSPDSNHRAGLQISGTSIQAPQGNITLAAIDNGGRVELKNNLGLEFAEDTILGDISFRQGSGIDVSGLGGGNIIVRGQDITLTEKSQLLASTWGDIDGGVIDIEANNLTIDDHSKIGTLTAGVGNSPDIKIQARESVTLTGNDSAAFQEFLFNNLSGRYENNTNSSVIYTFSLSPGKSGDITINSNNLAIQNGAWILASTFKDGDTGKITINTVQDVLIDNSGLIVGAVFNSQGAVDNLTINSKNLFLQHGGVVSSSTLGAGKGGDIYLTVLDSIHLRQSLADNYVPTGIFSNTVLGSGKAGNLNISSGNLIIQDDSQLSSASGAVTSQGIIPLGGIGGDINLKIKDLLSIRGNSPTGQFPSGIINNTFSDRPAGNITIQTGDLELQGQGTISASAIGFGDGGNLTINADNSVRLKGMGLENLEGFAIQALSGQTESLNLSGGLLSTTRMGTAGNITITAPEISLATGALVATTTFGQGKGGNVSINSDNLEVLAATIASASLGAGQAGKITIDTDNLITDDSGIIVSSGVGFGDAGDIKIDAHDSIQLLGNRDSFLIPGGIFTSSIGLSYPGNLEINTKDLTILGGNRIDASNGIEGLSGELLPESTLHNLFSQVSVNFNLAKSIVINAESIRIAGGSSRILFGTNLESVAHSGIATTTLSPFAASDVSINTSRLDINDGGEISVRSIGSGQAGNLEIIADSVSLDHNATLNGSTVSGTGGNIQLQVKDILSITDNSYIITNAENFGDGGNITIDTNFAIAAGNSGIQANALSGQGGNIKITATDLFISPDSQITASSQLGIDGTVKISTFTTTQRNNLAKLPQKVLRVDNLIAQSCGGSHSDQDTFTYTGRGGLSLNPLTNNRGEDIVLEDFNLVGNSSRETDWQISDRHNLSQQNPSTTDIVEAEGWRVNSKGKIELIAVAKKDFYSHCPFAQNR